PAARHRAATIPRSRVLRARVGDAESDGATEGRGGVRDGPRNWDVPAAVAELVRAIGYGRRQRLDVYTRRPASANRAPSEVAGDRLSIRPRQLVGLSG